MGPKERSASQSKKDKDKEKENEQTLDKHLKITETLDQSEGEVKSALSGFGKQLSALLSQIESGLKKMVTEDVLSKTLDTKLKHFEEEITNHIGKEIESVNTKINDLSNRVKEVEDVAENLRNKFSDMETAMEQLVEANEEQKIKITERKEKLQEREAKIKSHSEKLHNLEQYTRKNSVRIYGVDNTDEDESATATAKRVVKTVKDKLDISISIADIGMAHRMGRYSADANRPIICKFISRFVKQEVVKARRKLKNSAVIIREDLTLKNAKLLEKTSGNDLVKSAWSDDGKIIALLHNNKKVVVNHTSTFIAIDSE